MTVEKGQISTIELSILASSEKVECIHPENSDIINGIQNNKNSLKDKVSEG